MTEMIRANVNITIEDKQTLAKAYGYGWSVKIRDMIHEHCLNLRTQERAFSTLGDIYERGE